MALAQRAVQLVMNIIPFIRKHFENCQQKKNLKNNETIAETKQLETFRKQFEQAFLHLKNHSLEIEQKMLSVLETFISQQLSSWQPSKQLPLSLIHI